MADSDKKPGPKPDRVKIDDDWQEAVRKAFKKKRPKGGWPKPGDQKKDSESHSEGD